MTHKTATAKSEALRKRDACQPGLPADEQSSMTLSGASFPQNGPSTIDSIRVVICDLSPTTRSGLQHILSDYSDVDIVMSVSSRAEVLGKADDLDIDVILVDIDDEQGAGFEYFNDFRKRMPGIKIMVFTNCRDNKQIIEAVALGVEGFQCKQEADASQIINTVRTLHRGGKALASRVTEALLSEMQSDKLKSEARLSAREQQVLDLIALGKSNDDIAKKLGISIRTVKFHVSSILSKLKAKNRTEAALWVL